MDLSGVRSDINLVLEYHMNEASTIVGDERDYLRPWRRRLRDILITKNEEMLGFLEKPQQDWPAEKRHYEFIRTVRNLPSSSMRDHVSSITHNATILSDIESELSMPLLSLSTNIHIIMEKYQSTIRKLFEYNDRLDSNIAKIEELQKRLVALPDLDNTTTEAALLQESIVDYVEKCYETFNIKRDYELFCKTYAEFTAYRSILLPLQAATDTQGNPVCSICTTERVTIALNPCGHVFCNNCGQKQRSQCYICRCSVSNRLRLYFS